MSGIYLEYILPCQCDQVFRPMASLGLFKAVASITPVIFKRATGYIIDIPPDCCRDITGLILK